jgi:hypothetical protein
MEDFGTLLLGGLNLLGFHSRERPGRSAAGRPDSNQPNCGKKENAYLIKQQNQ